MRRWDKDRVMPQKFLNQLKDDGPTSTVCEPLNAMSTMFYNALMLGLSSDHPSSGGKQDTSRGQ